MNYYIIFDSFGVEAYVAEWSKALDLRSIVHSYAQVRTLSYAKVLHLLMLAGPVGTHPVQASMSSWIEAGYVPNLW